MSAKHEQWSSKLAFILATTGAAVGVGNIWKFPYMAGANGGSAFVLAYLLAVILVGIPIMLAEMVIGYRGQSNAINSLEKLSIEAKANPKWPLLGWFGLTTLLLILSFYSVISGWSFAYLYKTVTGQISGLDANAVNSTWTDLIGSPWQMILWHSVFMLFTMWIVERGVNRGLELASKWMMPLLFVILVLLDIYGTTTSGFKQAWHFMFDLKLNKITGSVIISALGHAFFTLAVGAGAMLVYASYVPKNTRIYGPILTIAFLDILVALLAGMAIFPIVYSYGLDPQGGPGLIFQVLPIAFAKMTGGTILAAMFFLLFIFAALTSSLSLAEPIVVMLAERYLGSRAKASVVVGLVSWLVGIGSCLSFNIWSDYKVFGKWTFFGVNTDLATNIMLPIGGLLFSIFAGWIMTKKSTKEDLQLPRPWLFNSWHFLIRYIAPIAIIIVFIDAIM